MSFAGDLETRLRGRPHVGVVLHFEGVTVPELAERLRGVVAAGGLAPEDALEEENGASVFNLVSPVHEGHGMELWLAASEKSGVGCKLEMRVFHAIEDSALADEYLARFGERIHS